jgi:putative membrane protein
MPLGACVAPSLASFSKEGDMRRLVYVLALGALGGGVALGGPGDQAFVDKAAQGGMAEVKLSKLAMDKGQSWEVKQFARKMVEDHTKANVELKQIADKKNLELPTKLDEQHEKAYDQLAKLEGANFDKEYMRVMAADHDDATKLFKEQAQRGQDPELKTFAMKMLPTIEKHDDLAHMDQSQMGAQPVTVPPLPRK